MQEAFAADPPRSTGWIPRVISLTRSEAPTLAEWSGSLATALLLVLSFPNFDLSFLAWIALVPLLVVLTRRPNPLRALILGWVAGSVFFYASCCWLTYSMIHYGGLPAWLAYLLLIPAALTAGIFPALFSVGIAQLIKRWNTPAILFAPFVWAACEWFRLGVTGQLWNAIGYSQAYHPSLIQTAGWGGVYLVGFLIAATNAAVAMLVLKRDWKSIARASFVLVAALIVLLASSLSAKVKSPTELRSHTYLNIVAIQPNVPMSPVKSNEETQELIERHLSMSASNLQHLQSDQLPRLVVWPESPMNFTYSSDSKLQQVVQKFVKENHTSLLLNSLEPAPNDGGFNSAVLINEDGRQISQYDKIRLLPFGEYVPLPYWLGGSLISGLVGDFTAGNKYTLMPIANHRAGVFICIESAYPSIAQNLTNEGADFLINISNDGYLGLTAVMRQHLANAVFRAVENGRPLLRVTNSGISAAISPEGNITEPTAGFVPDVRNWSVSDNANRTTFYTKHGDVFVELCALITLVLILGAFIKVKGV
jgi:apolipoprotein N-acyltransferase